MGQTSSCSSHSCVAQSPLNHQRKQHVDLLADHAHSIDTSLLQCLATAHWLTVSQLHHLYVDQQHSHDQIAALHPLAAQITPSPPTSYNTLPISKNPTDTSGGAKQSSAVASIGQLVLVCAITPDHPHCCGAQAAAGGAASSQVPFQLAVHAHPRLLDVVGCSHTDKTGVAAAFVLRSAQDRTQMFQQSAKLAMQQVTEGPRTPCFSPSPSPDHMMPDVTAGTVCGSHARICACSCVSADIGQHHAGC